jgi:hypothetical protein
MKSKVTGLLTLAFVLVSFQAVNPGCDSEKECEGPVDDIDPASDTATGQLPEWAVGSFGRHQVDITNLKIEASGVAYRIFDGGDYGGGCQLLAATFSDGRVHLTEDGNPYEDLVKTTTGHFYLGGPSTTDMKCGWTEYQATTLCGRDVGGCGGYGSAVPCSWEEVAGDRCNFEQDGGPTD